MQTVPIKDLPPLRYSVCKKFQVKDCTEDRPDDLPDLPFMGTDYPSCDTGQIPGYASSKDEFWRDLDEKKEKIAPFQFIFQVYKQYNASDEWEVVYDRSDTSPPFRHIPAKSHCLAFNH